LPTSGRLRVRVATPLGSTERRTGDRVMWVPL
jgi:hypothetical protein